MLLCKRAVLEQRLAIALSIFGFGLGMLCLEAGLFRFLLLQKLGKLLADVVFAFFDRKNVGLLECLELIIQKPCLHLVAC